MATTQSVRPFGAVPLEQGGTRFRLWAPAAQAVAVRAGGADQALEPGDNGVWEATLDVPPGTAYDGVRGPSRVVDTRAFRWSDDVWSGVALDELVVYELHVGTFSHEGTFDGVI